MMDDERILDALRTIVVFLSDNEQYGDDWSDEIEVLDFLINEMTFTSQEV